VTAALVAVLVIGCLIAAAVWYVTAMPGRSWSGPLPQLSKAERHTAARLQSHVEALAAHIGERNVWTPGTMAEAARYIRVNLEELGFQVRPQLFDSEGEQLANLEVELPGEGSAQALIVVGAHYDTVAGGPGADDNGSGVAVLLELARFLAGGTFSHSVRLVAFANEEAPFFGTDAMGSKLYAERARRRGERVLGMLSLETLGWYSDRRGSQAYPFPFTYLYPATGNFVAFVGDLASRRLVRRAVGTFRQAVAFPSEGVAAPRAIDGVGWSDHWSFWQMGYPALMVTDTAMFRYPHYHAGSDTPERLDYERLARVTAGLAAVVAELAEGNGNASTPPVPAPSER